MITNISWFQSALIFFTNRILIRQSCSLLFEMPHPSKGTVISLHILTSSCILISRHDGFKFIVPLNAFTTLRCTETRGISRTNYPYSAPRPSANTQNAVSIKRDKLQYAVRLSSETSWNNSWACGLESSGSRWVPVARCSEDFNVKHMCRNMLLKII
jgi:hypothetical protein